MGSIR